MSMTAEPPTGSRTVPPAGLPVRAWSGWVDRFLGSDPGLNRLRGALMTVVTIAAILGAEWLFVHYTNALLVPVGATPLPAAQAAKVAATNHDLLVIAMLVGAIVGMISAFAVMETDAAGQLVSMVFLPVPMIAGLALGIGLGAYRLPALIVLTLVMAASVYLRRFGPRGALAGMVLFMGYFFGFFLHADVAIGDLGWLSAEIGVGLVVAVIIRFALFYPRQSRALARTQRSYGARARKVAALALDLFDNQEADDRAARHLHRQLVRLNEAALMVDAQLGDPNAVTDGLSARLLHQRLFDVELALTNIARFAEAMGDLDLPPAQRAEVRLALHAIVQRDAAGARAHATTLLGLLREPVSASGDQNTIVVPHRFADSVLALADAMTDWLSLGAAASGTGAYQPPVALFGGWLPGSAEVSATASQERGVRRGDRIRLAPYTRAAIQMGVAVGLTIFVAVQLSSYRFYWAVLAAFITFMGANNAGEQARKACFRVAGTVVGIGIGSLLVTAVGHDPYWSIAIILVSLFFGFYLMRINYTFMVIGITVMVAQLYVQLGEFSDSLLLLRLEETALGAAITIAVVLLVLPLRTRRVLRIALRDHVQAVGALADHAVDRLVGNDPPADRTLHADARTVDATYQALVATAQPVRRTLLGRTDEGISQAMRVAAASRNYSRDLVADIQVVGLLDAQTRLDIERAHQTLRTSIGAVADALTGSPQQLYVRSSALFDRAERRLEQASGPNDAGRFAIRDTKLIDGAMAQLATALHLPITDYDTVGSSDHEPGTADVNESGRF